MTDDAPGSARYRRYVGLALIAVAVATGRILLLPRPPVSQPITFNHARHAALACVVCHQGSESGAQAGIPSLDLCQKCHATAPSGIGAAVWKEPAPPDAIRWVQLTRVPDHVMFSHRRHVALAGLDCTSCHGELATRTVPLGTAPIRLDMAACLSCHRRESASEDCAECHR